MSPSNRSIIAQRLKEARLEHGLTQEQLGILAGIEEFSASARMNRYEKGIHEPNFGMLKRIAEVLSLPPAYFYCEQEVLAELLVIVDALPQSDAESVLSFAKELRDRTELPAASNSSELVR